MAPRFWSICLYLLLVMCSQRTIQSRQLVGEQNENEVINDKNHVLRLHSMDGQQVRGHHHDHHMGQGIEGLGQVFFFLEDLRKGNTIPFYFSKKDYSSSPKFLSREVADSIPFSYRELSTILRLFSIPDGSPLANSVEFLLSNCEAEPMKGETKTCATSLESLLDFARVILGRDTRIRVLTTTAHTTPGSGVQNYTVVENPNEIEAPKMVSCHPVQYPYAVFFCHYMDSETRVLKASLRSESSGDRVEAVAVCHMDTSAWSPDHTAFRLLGIKPGRESPVCHFFPEDNFVWVPSPSARG